MTGLAPWPVERTFEEEHHVTTQIGGPDRRELERLGIGWCYWDLDTDFGAYDAARASSREPLRTALLAP